MLKSKSPSSTTNGKTIFITSGFQDRGISLYIDDFDSEKKFIDLAHLDWDRGGLTRAFWSNDGTLIACMNSFGQNEYFSYAYDFKFHRAFYPPDASHSVALDATEEDWRKHSEEIEALLDARGGKSSSSLERENIYNHGLKPSFWKWDMTRKKYTRF